MSRRRDNWRSKRRNEIEATANSARKALLDAKKLVLEKTQFDGESFSKIPLKDEAWRAGAALAHVQQAENELSNLRVLLQKYQERLQVELESESVWGPEVYQALTSPDDSRRKRPNADTIRAVVTDQWRDVPPTTWGRHALARRIGRDLGVSMETVLKYAKELNAA